MKQYISPDQLNELSKNARKELDVWFKKKQEKNMETGNVVLTPEPYLSIGEMIEFIGEEWVQVVFDEKYQIQWYPCDALWKVCKDILEYSD